MSNENGKPVAVKLEGCFTEWYSPTYKEPFDDNGEFHKYYSEHLIDSRPVAGPVLGGEDGHYIGGDIVWLVDRMCCGASDWQGASNSLRADVAASLVDGKTRTWNHPEVGEVKITPYTKAEMPPLTDEALAEFGPYASLIRERYEAI